MKNLLLSLCAVLLSIIANAQMVYLKANLSGAQEVPPNPSAGTGIVIVKYNMTTNYLQLTGDYQGLTTASTDAHIHGPAPAGSTAGVMLPLTHTGGVTGTLRGSGTLTPAQETDLLAGNTYVNVHSGTYPPGEIRGQLTVTTAGQTDIFTGRLQSAQEVPPNSSTGSGYFTALLDKGTGMVYVTGNFTGLTSAANNAHIHTGAPTQSGPPIINLAYSTATSGTIHVESTISAGDQTTMLNGNTYINIHSGTYPGGELRGQVITESQLVYLKATLQGSQQVPPTGSAARGTVIVRYNTTTRFLDLIGDYQNLATAVNASHIHSPAPPGTDAPVLFNLTNTGGTSGVITTTATLTAPQESDLLNGLMYVNIHNASFPGGEIRGQLTLSTMGQSFYFKGVMSGGQEVPANGSTATGNVTVLLDNLTNEVFLTGNFNGLTTAASDAHIHEANTGADGPPIVFLSATASTTGTVNGSGVVANSSADAMINGGAYINIHTATFPGGEIRAQLGNLVLPVKLKYFNGYMSSTHAVLNWESAEELNLKHYELEQQQQDGIWTTKKILPAAGNSATRYQVLDQPMIRDSRFVFYRLKMVDEDGKFSYSNVLRLSVRASQFTLSLTSNPVRDGRLGFQISGLSAEKQVLATIIDQTGRIIKSESASSMMINQLDISNLATGVYLLRVDVEQVSLLARFVK